MHKLAFLTMAALAALQPAAILAQTVKPADRYEGTPEVPLRKPTAQTATAIAPPAAPAKAAPPAGITWRNQAATPSVAPAGRPAPPPPVAVQRVAPAPVMTPPRAPPAVVQRVAPAPALAPRVAPPTIVQRPVPTLPILTPRAAPPVIVERVAPPALAEPRRDIMIHHDHAGAAHGPARVIVRRERMDDHHRAVEAYDGDHGYDMGAYDGGPDVYDGAPIDEDLRSDFQDYAEHHDSDFDGDRGSDHTFGYPVYGQSYVQAPCCSGGMITETITTTTTYPPTVTEHVSYRHVAEHKPARTYKRRLRRR